MKDEPRIVLHSENAELVDGIYTVTCSVDIKRMENLKFVGYPTMDEVNAKVKEMIWRQINE